MTYTPTIDIDDFAGVTGQGLFATLCARRGWTDEYLSAIQSDEHDTLKDVETMVAVLEDARSSRSKVVIAPDFDMDGIASGVLGYAGLSELGFDVELHLPDYRRGHDLCPEDIAEIHAAWPDTRVLLTCDGGVNSHKGIAAARSLGWTTLVTDHHAELEPGSSADVTVNPCRIDETYALKGICGAHVLYQVIEAHATAHRPDKLWEVRLLRLFAGLGTVSDVMPLLYENRQLVRDSLSLARLLWVRPPKTVPNRFGGLDPDLKRIDVDRAVLLQLLRADEHHPVFLAAFEGFALLLKAFTQAGKIREVDSIDEGLYGFYLAPAMNSPRRIEAPLAPCFEVFTAPTPEAKLDAARAVIEGNEHRKELTATYTEEILGADQPLTPWVYFSSAPAGMYGLLASQMMQRTGHPTVVVTRPARPDEFVSGSGRAPEWFDIISSLEPHEGLSAIGHQQACGVKVERADRLTQLAQVLSDETRLAMLRRDPSASPGDLVLGTAAEADAPLTDMTPLIELVERLESLKPFGHAFAEPRVEIVLPPVDLRVDRIGSDADCDHKRTPENGEEGERGWWVCFRCKKHLRVITRDGLACLWWNAADEHAEALASRVRDAHQDPSTEPFRFLAKLQLNEFMGKTRVQLVIDEQLA
ncbi:DHH family phosphoesterase [Nocardiopsis metallicus]|uniref:Single-stranded-DNA-specific exonuclease n=1 Tax=Nocardiopsis metallicus TaxID=179819 RepID=A0A840W5S6_9ACTN|nr:DHH family phosphoesterase [Nocardiopsis metallicus]MBB5491412.1 single-stranded-DNA-specific exonuclease [Nocardiopsis metallicus]